MKSIITAAITLTLSACGGGSSEPIQDHSATVAAAIPGIAANVPQTHSKPFTGAFMSVQGQSLGYIVCASPRACAEAVARAVISDPAKFAEFYGLMLSDAGLKVTIFGESVGTSGINGATLYAPDVVYMVKLTANGIVISGV
jgi:hypothetical protein